jgi:hypothetical protein
VTDLDERKHLENVIARHFGEKSLLFASVKGKNKTGFVGWTSFFFLSRHVKSNIFSLRPQKKIFKYLSRQIKKGNKEATQQQASKVGNGSSSASE